MKKKKLEIKDILVLAVLLIPFALLILLANINL